MKFHSWGFMAICETFWFG